MADVFETIERMTKTIQERLSATAIYGEPISANGVTVVPVARVRFGFGGGGGGGTGTKPGAMGEEALGEAGAGGGGGGGGGGMVEPLGFIEITDGGARWVPLEPSRAEIVLRAMMATAVIAPGGGRGGFFRRLMLMLAGQAAIGALMRPRLPALPEGMGIGRRTAAEIA
jgi:uncharacterized spore protein YtfJ